MKCYELQKWKELSYMSSMLSASEKRWTEWLQTGQGICLQITSKQERDENTVIQGF